MEKVDKLLNLFFKSHREEWRAESLIILNLNKLNEKDELYKKSLSYRRFVGTFCRYFSIFKYIYLFIYY